MATGISTADGRAILNWEVKEAAISWHRRNRRHLIDEERWIIGRLSGSGSSRKDEQSNLRSRRIRQALKRHEEDADGLQGRRIIRGRQPIDDNQTIGQRSGLGRAIIGRQFLLSGDLIVDSRSRGNAHRQTSAQG